MLTTLKINEIQVTLLNNLIKLDPIHVPIISRLKNNKSENYTFNNEEKLWYFQNYKNKSKLIDILYPDEKILSVEFNNNDFNDYRESNLLLKKDDRFEDNFKSPDGIEIITYGKSIKIIEGKYAGQYRNMYWEIKSKKNYIVMHIKENIYTKISKDDIIKILNINNIRPVWYIMENGYIATTLRLEDGQKICYLHQLIMDQHTKDNTDYKNTVDHINQDKLDNRKENLRIVNMSEQNKNKGKQTRRIDAKTDLPNGINILPKYVLYRKEIYDKENNSQREFFIVTHPNFEKSWETTKSNKISIHDKLKYAEAKIDLIENKITDEQFNKIIGIEDKVDLPVGIRLEIFREKYHYILDWRNDDKRYNVKMILHSTNIQKELDKFIDTIINEKYPELKMQKYQIENIINIDEKLISQVEQIIEENKPTYPKHITVYEEKGSMYIQYNKQTKDIRYNKKHKITSNDIQKEVDKLVKDINEKYTGYKLCSEKQTVINPNLFKLKDEPNIEISKDIPKPNLPINFSICNINGIDYFQYCKKENEQKVQKQKRINSYIIQEEFDTFVKLINEDFKLKLNNQIIENPQNWKTTNKILKKEPSEEKEKNLSKQIKYLAKKKAELGEEAFNILKAKQAKERREKKKLKIDI